MDTYQRRSRKEIEVAPLFCELCCSKLSDTRRGRRYCSKACRKTAEIRRYRFKKRHGVQFEDVVPKDGNWFSDLDDTIADALRAHHSSVGRGLTPCVVSRKRKGRPPLAEVVRPNGKINHMALRDQVFRIVVCGPARINGHRIKVRLREALLKSEMPKT